MSRRCLNKQILLFVIIIYFLFSQVYPYIHFHVDVEEKNAHIEMAFHPAQKCQFHHSTPYLSHQHTEKRHIKGDWEHTKSISSKKTFSLHQHFFQLIHFELNESDAILCTTQNTINSQTTESSHFSRGPPPRC